MTEPQPFPLQRLRLLALTVATTALLGACGGSDAPAPSPAPSPEPSLAPADVPKGLSVFLGTGGGTGNLDGLGTQARFGGYTSLALDANNELMVLDINNRSIRLVDAATNVTTPYRMGNEPVFFPTFRKHPVTGQPTLAQITMTPLANPPSGVTLALDMWTPAGNGQLQNVRHVVLPQNLGILSLEDWTATPDGTVYLVGTPLVARVDPGGQVTVLGRTELSGFRTGAAVDATGRVYVVESGSAMGAPTSDWAQRVRRFNPDGTSTLWPLPRDQGVIDGLGIDAQGQVWASVSQTSDLVKAGSPFTHALLRVNAGGTFERVAYGSPSTPRALTLGQMVVGPQGQLWAGAVLEGTAEHGWTNRAGLAAPTAPARWLQIDASDRVYFNGTRYDRGGQAAGPGFLPTLTAGCFAQWGYFNPHITLHRSPTESEPLPTQFPANSCPSSPQQTSDGTIYFLNAEIVPSGESTPYGERKSIYRRQDDGALQLLRRFDCTDSTPCPSSMLVSPDAKTIYLGLSGMTALFKLDVATRTLTPWTGVGADARIVDGPAPQARMRAPKLRTVDGRGNVYFTDYGTDFAPLIRVVATDGSVRTVAGQDGLRGFRAGALPGSLPETTNEVFVDSQGVIYAASEGSVIRVNPN